jgi:hypothetical protein
VLKLNQFTKCHFRSPVQTSYGGDEEDEGAYGTSFVGSYTKTGFGYGPEVDGENDAGGDDAACDQKPRILLMGLRRSGKSSIQKVVFHKMSPNETLFLESTNKINKEIVSNSSFVQFHIWDFPGQIDFFDPTFDPDMIFGGSGAVIFVIDAQVSSSVKLTVYRYEDVVFFSVSEICVTISNLDLLSSSETGVNY